uniref:Uncharacterized protein n=1 Tax=Populus davidiana TaxID=266767 RepID=A0A6M2EKV2_9ROSI
MEGDPGYNVGKWGENGAAGFCGSGGSSVRVRLCVDKRERGQCMGLRLKEEENGKIPLLLRVQGRRRKVPKGTGDCGLPTTDGTRKNGSNLLPFCKAGDEKK